MRATNWKWTRMAANFEDTPSVDMMREHVMNEFKELLRSRNYSASRSGGFKVSRYKDESKRTCYALEFILEHEET